MFEFYNENHNKLRNRLKTKKRPASKRKNFYNGLDGPTPMSMWPHSLGIKAITSSWEGAVDDRRVRGAQV